MSDILPYTRREFLRTAGKGLGLVAFAAAAPRFLTQSLLAGNPAPEKDMPVLVLIQLAGGNDGLNTVVPYEDDNYYRLRPTIAIKPTDPVHRLAANTALHPSLGALANLSKEGRLSIVRNVGYPNPNRSHFRSTEIWETATDANVNGYSGWVGRYFDAACDGKGRDPVGIHTTGILPQAFMAEKPHNTFGLAGGGGGRRGDKRPGARRLADSSEILSELNEAPLVGEHKPDDNAEYLRHTLMDAIITETRVQDILAKDKPEAEYPNTGIGRSLKQIAALIAANLETRVYYASQGGFDTHANQLNGHARILQELSDAMAAFQKDMDKRGLASRVTTMTFSEFGRRPSENGTSGTDHGTAAPLFVMGPGIKTPLVGEAPDLHIEKNKDIVFETDFRQVYSTILHKRLGVDPAKVIAGKPFAELNIV